MKVVAIIFTLSLLGVMGWLMKQAQDEARGTRNQLDLMRQQQVAGTSTSSAASATKEELAAAARESQMLMEQAAAAPPPPPTPPVSRIPGAGAPAGSVAGAPGTSTAGQEVAPLPLTARQRRVIAAPSIAQVTEYDRDYAFVVIGGATASKVEPGMTFSIRRGGNVVGRIKISKMEDAGAIADVLPNSIPVGLNIEPGDDVIQDVAPDA